MPPSQPRFHRDFPGWLASRFFSSFARQMVRLVIAWRVYEISKDPLLLGLLGLAESLPYVAISLWAGQEIDRHEKRSFMLRAQSGYALCAAALLWGLRCAPHSTVPLFAAVAALGFLASFEQAASTAYAQMIIAKERYSRAAAWNLTLFQAASIAGPIVAGALVSRVGNPPVLVLALVFWAVALTMSARLSPVHPPAATGPRESDWERIRFGLRFIRSQPLLVSAMSLDMFAVLFGDCVALFPIFADRMGTGAFGLGLLRASPGVGSALLSLAHALSQDFIRPTWRSLRAAVLVFGLAMWGFALSHALWMAAIFLIVGGMADAVSVITRQSIAQALTPDHLRARVAAVNGIFISTSNEIGAFESGVMARILGAVGSVLFGGSITLASTALAGPLYRRYAARGAEISASPRKP